VERIEVVLPWRRLVGATDRIDALTVSQATVRLRVGADGAGNWSRLFPEPEGGTAPPAEPARWSLGNITLEGGAIDYRDAVTGAAWQLTGMTLQAREVAPGAAFPLELQAAGIAGESTFHFASQGEARLDVAVGRYEASTIAYRGWLGGEPLPLAGAELTGTLAQAAYESSAASARFAGGRFEFAEIPGRFEGTLALGAPAMIADFRVATEAFAPRAPAIILGHPLPATSDPAAFESLQVTATVRMQDGELSLDPFSGRLDDTNFEGRVIPGRRFVRASLDAIDFNRYLPQNSQIAGTPAAQTPKATLETIAGELAALDIDAELRVGEARVGGAQMRDAVIRITPDGGSVP
jgi:AsmA protein